MGTQSDDFRKDLNTLILAKYSLPPKEFAQEELAVKQTLQKMLHVLAQPKAQHSMLATVPIQSIEDMTKRGQLTVIAKGLDDAFLRSVERVIKKSDIEFKADGEKIRLSDLYNICRVDLLTEKNKEPDFGDILLRMYTEDSPFFKKLNAIVGGYNNPEDTTNDEKKLSLLLNVAIHKAGLDKRKFEVQQTPEVLYRGQSFGLDNFVKKFEKVKELHAQGKLTNLSPQELAEINVVDIAAKKAFSTTTDLGISFKFARKTGLVLHIKNPEELADFYNVANISKYSHEAEFISRIPDDIVMVPISITKDQYGVSHVEVVSIHSQSVLIGNSTRMHDIRESLESYLKEKIGQNFGFMWYFPMYTFQMDQLDLMDELKSIINESEKVGVLDIDKQKQFLESAFFKLEELYNTKPTSYQKKQFDVINAKLQDYAAIVADLKVVHETYHPLDITIQEEGRLKSNLEGKRIWLASIVGQSEEILIAPLKRDLGALLSASSSLVEIRNAAKNIVDLLKKHPEIEKKFPVLKDNMTDVLDAIDKITRQKENLPSVSFKTTLQQFKEKRSVNDCEELEKSAGNKPGERP